MLNCETFDTSVFDVELVDGTAIMRLKDESLRLSMDQCFLRYFLDYLNSIEENDDVKGLLIVDSPVYHGVDDIKALISDLQHEQHMIFKKKVFQQYGSTTKRLTLALNEFHKPLVVALEGLVPIDLFGYFMACDAIIASDDISIEFPSYEFGMAPIGAVTFFLQKEIGVRNTMNLYLSHPKLDADAALNYSLVDQVVEKENLIETALAQLEDYYQFSQSSMVMTKQVCKVKSSELNDFFEDNVRLMWNASLSVGNDK
ncbi:MAG: enoyl-CoA hydratase/isomerase family protein [Gammaproteobacteria bacterium]|nr:enoyl-CoA hydratase/isomerase family protein [Gammaproteobacteria bacterium]